MTLAWLFILHQCGLRLRRSWVVLIMAETQYKPPGLEAWDIVIVVLYFIVILGVGLFVSIPQFSVLFIFWVKLSLAKPVFSCFFGPTPSSPVLCSFQSELFCRFEQLKLQFNGINISAISTFVDGLLACSRPERTIIITVINLFGFYDLAKHRTPCAFRGDNYFWVCLTADGSLKS